MTKEQIENTSTEELCRLFDECKKMNIKSTKQLIANEILRREQNETKEWLYEDMGWHLGLCPKATCDGCEEKVTCRERK